MNEGTSKMSNRLQLVFLFTSLLISVYSDEPFKLSEYVPSENKLIPVPASLRLTSESSFIQFQWPENVTDSSREFPLLEFVDAGSVRRELLCDPEGYSSFYREELDLRRKLRIITTSSCPNHFSVCQATECGGSKATLSLIHYTSYEIPAYPYFSKSARDTTCTARPLGIALNGVILRGPKDSDDEFSDENLSVDDNPENGHTGTRICGTPAEYGQVHEGRSACSILGPKDGVLYCGDGLLLDSRKYDKCGGQADSRGRYHYRMAPLCLLSQLIRTREANISNDNFNKNNFAGSGSYRMAAKIDASPQLGWALDGFPVYGPLGPKGTLMLRCGLPGAHSQLCLDYCNGYRGSLRGYDEFLYRYYMTGDHVFTNGSDSLLSPSRMQDVTLCSSAVTNSQHQGTDGREGSCERNCCASGVPSKRFFPYSIGCFRGCPINDTTCSNSGERGFSKYYIPRLALGTAAPSSTVPHNSSEINLMNMVHVNNDSLVMRYLDLNTISITDSENNNNNNISRKYVASQLSAQPIPERETTASSEAERQFLQASGECTATKIKSSSLCFAGKVAVRIGNRDRSMAIVSSDKSYSSGSEYVLQNVSTTPRGLQEFPASKSDHLITSMSLSIQKEGLIYYATSNGIFSLYDSDQDLELGADHSSVSVPIVEGLLRVVLSGFNLGSFRKDILSLAIRGVPCNNVVFVDSQTLTCLYTDGEMSRTGKDMTNLDAADVTLETIGGHVQGVYADPMNIVLSGSGRPVLGTVEFYDIPFSPYAITTILYKEKQGQQPIEESVTAKDSEVLYWSNMGMQPYNIPSALVSGGISYSSGYGIYRCSPDGKQVEKVLDPLIRSVPNAYAVEKIRSLVVADYRDICSDSCVHADIIDHVRGASMDIVFYVEASGSGGLFALLVPKLIAGSILDVTVDVTISSIKDNTASDNESGSTGIPIRLISNVQSPTGLSLDVQSRYLFISTMNGVVLRVNLDEALSFTSLTDGNSFNESVLPFITTKNPMTSLPSWIRVLVLAPSHARLFGVASVPLETTSTPKMSIRESWKEQRIVAVDTNLERLYLTSDAGQSTTSIDFRDSPSLLDHKYSLITWPSALCLPQTDARDGDPSSELLTAYIAEFLGRIWKIQIPRATSGNTKRDGTIAVAASPRLLLDASNFHSSNVARNYLGQAKDEGLPGYSNLFFEAID